MTYSQGHSRFPRQACIAMLDTGDESTSTRHLGHTSDEEARNEERGIDV
jgi:hypothetical protein